MGLEAVSQMADADEIMHSKNKAFFECFNRVFDCYVYKRSSKVQGIYLPCSQITALHYIKEHVHVISSHCSPILNVSLTKFITLICY